MPRDLDDVRRVPAARTLGVEGVDGAALDRGERVLDVPGLVEAVRVQRHLNVEPVGDIQGHAQRGRCGAEVLVHLEAGRAALASPSAQERLAQRRKDLAPWVNAATRLVPADRWLSFDSGKTIAFEQGGIRFRVIDSGGAHSPEDIMLFVEEEGVLFAGDLFATGRIPFVGSANSKAWLEALEQMAALSPAIAVPGHGAASRDTGKDIRFTREYLGFIRQAMSSAVEDMTPFDEAYSRTDWSRFKDYPAFEQANRINAYGTYLLIEQESLAK